VDTIGSVLDFAIDPFRRDFVWALASESFFYSTNAGADWIEPDTTHPDLWMGLILQASAVDTNRLFAAIMFDVMETTDGGGHWTTLDNGWPDPLDFVDELQVVRPDRNEIWAAMDRFGIWSYTVSDSSDAVAETRNDIPLTFTLSAYPNSFNPTTTISFVLAKESRVKVEVFDVMGRKAGALLWAPTSIMSAGEHRVVFDGSKLASGNYFVRVEAGAETRVQKMVLIK
jgi:hypothetical protein